MVSSAPTFTLQDYLDIAVRRKWLIIGAVALALSVSAVLCVVLPKSYRSSTLILIENQKIPERYVQSVVEGTVQERLTVIQQQVMSRRFLTKVIEDLKLFPAGDPQTRIEALVFDARKNIKVETKGGGRGQLEAFSISYAHENPEIAMKVTAKVASLFIEENLRIREQIVEGASEFLDVELRSAKATLEQKEQALGEFKKEYMGELPGQLDANLRTLDRLQAEVPSINEAITSMTERLAAAERALKEYEATGSTATTGQGSPSRPSDPLHARLKELERNLATLSAEYKESYPDIVSIKQQIRQLKGKLARRQEAVEPDKARDGKQGGAPQLEPGDPFLEGLEKQQEGIQVEVKRGAETFDPYLKELKAQRDEARSELATLKSRLGRILAQIKEYEGRVERSPAREQEFMILQRDYDNMQRNYQSLLDKKLNARVAENLEKRQKGEQFRILDEAYLPTTPEKPDPLRIMLAGLVLGCGVGYGGAFALEYFNPSFRRPEEAEEALGHPVVAEIPNFDNAFDQLTALPAPGEAGAAATGAPRLLDSALGAKPDHPAWGRWTGGGRSRNTTKATARAVSPDLNLVSRWNPGSIVAEQFRVAATRLALLANGRASTVIVVTSAVKGEGKSSTVSNLGHVLANDLGKSTLIIDADLKQPVIHAYTGVPLAPGLADLIHGDQSLEACLRSMGESSLWVLPAGSVGSKPVDLGKMTQLVTILAGLRERFEFILVDAPPILPLADMNVLASLADVLLVVVRAGATGREVVRKALKKLQPSARTGIVLTASWVDRMPNYMHSYGYVGAGKASQS